MSESGDVLSISEALPRVMEAIGFVGKGNKAPSQQGGYAFRGIDDVMAALQPALIQYGVSIIPFLKDVRMDTYETTRGTTMNHAIVIVEYHCFAQDGSHIVGCAPGEGSDTGDKAINKAMAGAMKYFVTQALCIPTEEQKDSESYNTEARGRAVSKRAPKRDFEEYAQSTPESELDEPLAKLDEKITRQEAKTLFEHAYKRGGALGMSRDEVERRLRGFFVAIDLPINTETGKRSSLDLTKEQHKACWLWIEEWKPVSENEKAAEAATSEEGF